MLNCLKNSTKPSAWDPKKLVLSWWMSEAELSGLPVSQSRSLTELTTKSNSEPMAMILTPQRKKFRSIILNCLPWCAMKMSYSLERTVRSAARSLRSPAPVLSFKLNLAAPLSLALTLSRSLATEFSNFQCWLLRIVLTSERSWPRIPSTTSAFQMCKLVVIFKNWSFW